MTKAQIRKQLIADTEQRVLAITREMVSEGGWGAAQIALIAHRAGVATGSVYRYFDSKADLCAQVLAAVSQREIDVVAAIVDSEGDATVRLHDAVVAFVRRASRNPRLAYALIAEPCERELDEARLAYRAALAKQFSRLIAEGIARGEFVDLPSDLLSTCVTGAFMESLVGPLAREAHLDPQEIDALAQQVANLCVRMVRAGSPALALVKAKKGRT
ncbi:TetR/AcrR family transcriptional regulator [Hydrogenophaga sp.]|jgi:AcrR family transcriptional regulator|uniref:TetR/AcrR family transcriptional regulator n=1 Tax=Hydrogenophaga sp. TaxID=1904254 RepID=UPI003F6EF6DF